MAALRGSPARRAGDNPFALIAIGGEYGTLSEMAFGLHFDRLVIALEDAPEVPGALRCPDVETALERARDTRHRVAVADVHDGSGFESLQATIQGGDARPGSGPLTV